MKGKYELTPLFYEITVSGSETTIFFPESAESDDGLTLKFTGNDARQFANAILEELNK